MVAWFSALVALLWPAWLWACPSCANTNSSGLSFFILMFSMIALPFGVAIVVYRVVKHGEAKEQNSRSPI